MKHFRSIISLALIYAVLFFGLQQGTLAQEQALSAGKPDRVFERGTKTGLNGVRVVGGADWTLIDLASFLNA